LTDRHERADAREERRAMVRQIEYLHRMGVFAVHYNRAGERVFTLRPECAVNQAQCDDVNACVVVAGRRGMTAPEIAVKLDWPDLTVRACIGMLNGSGVPAFDDGT
jgi:hypothetical protein